MASRKGDAHASNIMDALGQAPRPLSAYDLLDRLRPTGVTAPLTVYRALDKLIAAGKVHRIESLNAFVACCDGAHHHAGDGHGPDGSRRSAVAFAICDRCGQVDEFLDQRLFARLDEDLSTRGFAPRASAVEVHGTCAACAATAPG
ncbi:Fur family transcriptional regulator [Lichenihabitans sp. Uapishka_5]|uniref:Fur family transcriptional regulator n=1 Tax=Lichenihabitans sp. Uapishka_5 TaxID=3037302 RepID=UPI0029E7ED60|nr:Fur family transcriptional regulator [Lichenihabitans sp. Uapishka_5]MDX7949595.1 Fur family transcriptional regulator [Lichenihabitans sp. Uapishka_5]